MKDKNDRIALAIKSGINENRLSHMIDKKVASGPFRRLLKTGVALPVVPYMYLTNRYAFRSLVHSTLLKKKFNYFPYMEIVLTTRCSLRCKYCANLMQYYEHPCDVPIGTLKRSVERLMELTDSICELKLLGGEPFLYPHLAEMIEFCLLFEKKVQHIEIGTNGTVPIRDERVWRLLQHKKIQLRVSDYGLGKVDSFCEQLEAHGVKYRRMKASEDLVWEDCGKVYRRHRSVEELDAQFQNCSMFFRNILNGQLHICPRSSAGADLGLIPAKTDEYLNLLDDVHPVTKEQLFDYYYRDRHVTACDYCDNGTGKLPVVTAGKEQLQKSLYAQAAAGNGNGGEEMKSRRGDSE